MIGSYPLAHLWDVLAKFIIPLGFGIPAGILKAQTYHIHWAVMLLLYLISDLLLALAFEPLLLLFIKYTKGIPKFAKLGEIFKMSIQKTIRMYGNSSGVFALIVITYGADPMTGRTVAVAAGHGFVVGWMIAITGDMLYFATLMASTLWLNSIIGDANKTMFIIMTLMLIIPILIKKIRNKFNQHKS